MWEIFFNDSLINRMKRGTQKRWSCVILNFFDLSPRSFIVSWSTQPKGAKEAFGMENKSPLGRGKAKPWETSDSMSFLRASPSLSADLWFSRVLWKCRYMLGSSVEIGRRGKVAPCSRICLKSAHSGWSAHNGSRSMGWRNSEPNEIKEFGWARIAWEMLNSNLHRISALWRLASSVVAKMNCCLFFGTGEFKYNFLIAHNIFESILVEWVLLVLWLLTPDRKRNEGESQGGGVWLV